MKVKSSFNLLPVAHLAHCELEDAFPTGFEGAPQITIGECPNQMILIVDNKQAPTSFASQFH